MYYFIVTFNIIHIQRLIQEHSNITKFIDILDPCGQLGTFEYFWFLDRLRFDYDDWFFFLWSWWYANLIIDTQLESHWIFYLFRRHTWSYNGQLSGNFGACQTKRDFFKVNNNRKLLIYKLMFHPNQSRQTWITGLFDIKIREYSLYVITLESAQFKDIFLSDKKVLEFFGRLYEHLLDLLILGGLNYEYEVDELCLGETIFLGFKLSFKGFTRRDSFFIKLNNDFAFSDLDVW